jgi:hypothetical protein
MDITIRDPKPGLDQKIISSRKVKTFSGPHQASYRMSTGTCLREENRPEREDDLLPSISAKVKNKRRCTFCPFIRLDCEYRDSPVLLVFLLFVYCWRHQKFSVPASLGRLSVVR